MTTTQQYSSRAPLYSLEKPQKLLSEEQMTKSFHKLLDLYSGGSKEYFDKANEPEYLYWDRLKYKQPPQDMNIEEFWFLVRQIRQLSSKETSIIAENGLPFTWLRLNYTDEFLHKIDTNSGSGYILAQGDNPIITKLGRQKLITRGILEEAIASSQLEGAHTTRSAAKKMILEKRKPKNESEQMILNNYKTITFVESSFKNSPLSLDLLFEMHRMLTDKTLAPEKQGRLRKDVDDIVVQEQIGNETYTTHIPPKETFLEQEMKKLIAYANDDSTTNFIHPIVKAIFIHFWVGYLYPFVDGNGRLARALFYWYLLRKGYWTFIYMPISTIIKNAPHQYAMTYIYTEQDVHDLTYFYDFHIRKIIQSIKEFDTYIKTKTNENKRIDQIVSAVFPINERQREIIHYLCASKDAIVTITSHKTINQISRQTAAKDLSDLEDAGLVQAKRFGKSVHYSPTEKLLQLAEQI